MNPSLKIAGLAGILAGIGLLVEGIFFMTSGWTPEVFANPSQAIAFLRDSGTHLRAAVFAGAINLVFTTVFIAGLAATLQAKTPTRAATTLYFGIIGITGYSLVPLGLWLGVPMFVELAANDPVAASSAWGGFNAFLSGAGAVGSLFLGLSLLAAGSAIVSEKALPVPVGWIGLLTGVGSAGGVLVADTPLEVVATLAYFPTLLLVIVFRIWAGIALRRSAEPTPEAHADRLPHAPQA